LSLAFCMVALSCAPAQETKSDQLTAQRIVDRISERVTPRWSNPTIDTFKAGDPSTRVRGVACVMMATFEVLKRASDGGANFIITHEPTFYGHQDVTSALEAERDVVLAAKQELIRSRGLVIWRFHDHMHRMMPDMVVTGVTRALGWEKFQVASGEPKYVLPATTLEQLAREVRARLRIPTLRVVGDPVMTITKVGLSPGFSGFARNRQLLREDDVEVMLLGEANEWETIEYAADAIAQGKRKALLVLGHIPSEEAGMRECARWLKTFVSEVPVEFVATPDPFWTPDDSTQTKAESGKGKAPARR
jgi:putative NIF3 family GTP cyclohydrolase 1 type 2